MILMLLFLSSTLIALHLSWRGDDDLGYVMMERQLSANEAFRRTWFIIAKVISVVCGAGLLAIALAPQLFKGVHADRSIVDTFAVVCMVAVLVLWSIGQNIIRGLRRRTPRRILDFGLLAFNLRRWRDF